MKTFVSALSAIAGVVLSFTAHQATFKTSTEGTWVTASVIDKDGRLITDLTKDDFEVRDNGTVREIIAFRNDVVPVAVAIMVDISLSMADNFATTRRAVTEFVGRFEPGDRATIGGFDALPWIAPHFSSRPQVLQRFLSNVMAGTAGLCTGDWIDMTSLNRPRSVPPPQRPGPPQTTSPGYGARPLFGQRLLQHQGTSVWDGLACGINAAASDGETPRRVVIVLTDGIDYTSSTTPASVITEANEAGVMIYTVGLAGTEGLAAGALRGIAEATGGGYFTLNSRADMVDAFGHIADELRHQYVFAFSAPGSTPASRPSRDVQVRALRADTTTRSRRVFMGDAPVRTHPAVAAAPAAAAMPIEDQLRAAIATGSARYDVPISVGTGMRRGSGSAPIDLAVNVVIPASATGPLTTMFGLVDESGAPKTPKTPQTMKSGRKVVAAPSDGDAYRLAFSLPVSPGIYKLRFAAADATGAVGSLEAVVEVTLPTMGPFQVSDLLTSWTGADGAPQFLGVEDLPAGVKTINVMLELYSARPSPEDVHVRLGLYAGTQSQPLGEKDVVPGRTGGTLRAEAPLSVDTLEPGPYVLRATVLVAGKEVGTTRRFLKKNAGA